MNKEISVPISSNCVELNNVIYHNVSYHNVLIPDCPKYIPHPRREDTYIRESNIVRWHDESVLWPPHPFDASGKMLGAIVLIESADDKILLVRNGRLWGLPKGARNYREFLQAKELSERAWAEGTTMVHEKLTLANLETAAENACREAFEETGINIIASDLVAMDSEKPYCWFYYKFPHMASEHRLILQMNGTDYENDELVWTHHDVLRKMLRAHVEQGAGNKIFNHVSFAFLSHYIDPPKVMVMTRRLSPTLTENEVITSIPTETPISPIHSPTPPTPPTPQTQTSQTPQTPTKQYLPSCLVRRFSRVSV